MCSNGELLKQYKIIKKRGKTETRDYIKNCVIKNIELKDGGYTRKIFPTISNGML